MTGKPRHLDTDLAIIGSGLAGFGAAVFALNRGIKCLLVGNAGALAYTTGYLDLLGAIEQLPDEVDLPYRGLEQLRHLQPDHPLAGLSRRDIERAFRQFTAFLAKGGLGYTSPGSRNITALTPAGTLKKTLCVPATMAAGPRALTDRTPCVIVNFHGLKGFSGRQLVANLRERWPELTSRRLVFPGMSRSEVYPEAVARSLEVPATRQQLARLLIEAAGGVKVVGLPALLGMHRPDLVHADLERLTGLELFEIPTMPPAVPGTRLRELCERELPQHGLTLIPQQKVRSVEFLDTAVRLGLTDNLGPIEIACQAVILATGRFLSGGLMADYHRIREPLLGLPVCQPANRDLWYRQDYLDRRGHSLHRAGLEVDRSLRPLAGGRPYDPRLFAAGTILAHQDWTRGRCGAGLALATAFKAVEAAAALLGRRQETSEE